MFINFVCLSLFVCYDSVDDRCDKNLNTVVSSIDKIYELSYISESLNVTLFNDTKSTLAIELNKIKSKKLYIIGKNDCHLKINFSMEWQNTMRVLSLQDLKISNLEESTYSRISSFSTKFINCSLNDHLSTMYYLDSDFLECSTNILTQIYIKKLKTISITISENTIFPSDGFCLKNADVSNLLIEINYCSVHVWWDYYYLYIKPSNHNHALSFAPCIGINTKFLQFKYCTSILTFDQGITANHTYFTFRDSSVTINSYSSNGSNFIPDSKFSFQSSNVIIYGDEISATMEFRSNVGVSFYKTIFKCVSFNLIDSILSVDFIPRNFILEVRECLLDRSKIISKENINTIISTNLRARYCQKQILSKSIVYVSESVEIIECNANFTNFIFYDSNVYIEFKHSQPCTNYFDYGSLPIPKKITCKDIELISDYTIEPIVGQKFYILCTPDISVEKWRVELEINYQYQISNNILFNACEIKNGICYFGFYFIDIPSKILPEICYSNDASKCSSYGYHVDDNNLSMALQISKEVRGHSNLYLKENMATTIDLYSSERVNIFVYGNGFVFLGLLEMPKTNVSLTFYNTIIDINSSQKNINIGYLNLSSSCVLTDNTKSLQISNTPVCCSTVHLNSIIKMTPKVITCVLNDEDIIYYNKKITVLMNGTSSILSIPTMNNIYFWQNNSNLQIIGCDNGVVGYNLKFLLSYSNTEEKRFSIRGNFSNSSGFITFNGNPNIILYIYSEYLPIQTDFTNITLNSLIPNRVFIPSQKYLRLGKHEININRGNFKFECLNILSSMVINISLGHGSAEIFIVHLINTQPLNNTINCKISNGIISNAIVLDLGTTLTLSECNINNTNVTINIEPGGKFSFMTILTGDLSFSIPKLIYVNFTDAKGKPTKQIFACFMTNGHAKEALPNVHVSQSYITYNSTEYWISVSIDDQNIFIDYIEKIDTIAGQQQVPIKSIIFLIYGSLLLSIVIMLLNSFFYFKKIRKSHEEQSNSVVSMSL